MSLGRSFVRGGLPLGAVYGTMGYLPDHYSNGGKKTRKERLADASASAVGGAVVGTALHRVYGGPAPAKPKGHKQHPRMRSEPKPDSPKLEAAKRWNMKPEDIVKKAMYAGFADELQKIAMGSAMMAGGLIGAGAGGLIPGPNKIRNGLIGGAIGTVGGAIVGGVKHHFIDPDHERSAQLSALPPSGDPNYVPTWQRGYQ